MGLAGRGSKAGAVGAYALMSCYDWIGAVMFFKSGGRFFHKGGEGGPPFAPRGSTKEGRISAMPARTWLVWANGPGNGKKSGWEYVFSRYQSLQSMVNAVLHHQLSLYSSSQAKADRSQVALGRPFE